MAAAAPYALHRGGGALHQRAGVGNGGWSTSNGWGSNDDGWASNAGWESIGGVGGGGMMRPLTYFPGYRPHHRGNGSKTMTFVPASVSAEAVESGVGNSFSTTPQQQRPRPQQDDGSPRRSARLYAYRPAVFDVYLAEEIFASAATAVAMDADESELTNVS